LVSATVNDSLLAREANTQVERDREDDQSIDEVNTLENQAKEEAEENAWNTHGRIWGISIEEDGSGGTSPWSDGTSVPSFQSKVFAGG
jgi:hypothetical protein